MKSPAPDLQPKNKDKKIFTPNLRGKPDNSSFFMLCYVREENLQVRKIFICIAPGYLLALDRTRLYLTALLWTGHEGSMEPHCHIWTNIWRCKSKAVTSSDPITHSPPGMPNPWQQSLPTATLPLIAPPLEIASVLKHLTSSFDITVTAYACCIRASICSLWSPCSMRMQRTEGDGEGKDIWVLTGLSSWWRTMTSQNSSSAAAASI